MRVNQIRLMKASFGIAVGFSLLAVMNVCETGLQTADEPVADRQIEGPVLDLGSLEEVNSENLLSQIEEAQKSLGAYRKSLGDLPPWFHEELLSLQAGERIGIEDCYMDATESIVSFTSKCDCQKLQSLLEGELRGNGWIAYESGYEGCMSFTKEGGRCRWVLLSCVAIGEKSVATLIVSKKGDT